MSQQFLETKVEFLKGVGPKKAESLTRELNIRTFDDLITYYPFRYVDRSRFYTVSEINDESAYVQLRGKITGIQLLGTGHATRLSATFRDATGSIELIWFQGIKWVKDKFSADEEYVVFGKPSLYNGRYNITHPEVETWVLHATQAADTLQPFYNTTEKLKAQGLTSRAIGKLTHMLVTSAKGRLSETLPDEILQSEKLIGIEEALTNIHFPPNPAALAKAEKRIKFEELFFIQLRLLKLKILRMQKLEGLKFPVIGELFNSFYHKYLPFELTGAQKKVLREIRADLGSGHQMNRLLQGDVGSGKTLVALMSMLIALDNGYQACLMAPTELLANQHFATISRMLSGMPVQIDLLTGNTKKTQRRQLHENLAAGELHILIGTHALIEDTVIFSKLGLVIIDEQHRFGVEQRARMWSKSPVLPHILVMTATPIPRTLAMTLYGDLDYSVIDELPPGRKPVKTYHFFDKDLPKVFGFMKRQIEEGRQIYVVYPLIKESEKLDLKDLMEGYETIVREFPPPEYAVCMVHGQMKSADKESEMQRFVRGETHIMVATTVIEVGVDVPNASVMVIENAERFGLSQLHQLRGRVGRGADFSHCLLLTSYKLTMDGRKRIETMVRTSDGFEIADTDLRLRGPGDLEGTQQSGIVDLKLADIIHDERIIREARELATVILDDDPLLEKAKNYRLAEHLNYMNRIKTNMGMIS
ncbi:MAG TPA: ATP-dependent DNA helicase RecG [Bacteroidales bacterium]